MKFTVLFTACAGILSCAQSGNTSHQPIKFTGNTKRIQFDTTLYSIAWSNGHIIAAQNNGKLLILDSNYQRQATLETRLNKDHLSRLFCLHDTVFIVAKNTRYYLDTGMNWQVDNDHPLKEDRTLLWDDDTWSVSECCMGEFGGSVFFVNKKTNKTWSYPATCASQVMKYKNGYWICNNLAHLGRHTSYTLIPDPEKTYDVTDTMQKSCNWWATIDSIENRRTLQAAATRGIKTIAAPDQSMTAQAFVYHDSLYAVLSNNKSTCIAVLKQDSMVVRDTIFRHPINFHYTQTIQAGEKTISLLNLTGGSPVEAYFFTGNSSAIMVTNGTNIDLLLNKIKSQ